MDMNMQVCAAAVGLMGDLCRALGVKVLPYCDETMVMLLENLQVCMNACVVLHIASVLSTVKNLAQYWLHHCS